MMSLRQLSVAAFVAALALTGPSVAVGRSLRATADDDKEMPPLFASAPGSGSIGDEGSLDGSLDGLLLEIGSGSGERDFLILGPGPAMFPSGSGSSLGGSGSGDEDWWSAGFPRSFGSNDGSLGGSGSGSEDWWSAGFPRSFGSNDGSLDGSDWGLGSGSGSFGVPPEFAGDASLLQELIDEMAGSGHK